MTAAARRTVDLAISEADWQTTVVDLAQTLGWLCLHVNDSRKQIRDRSTGELRLVGDTDAAGLPDWILLRERIVFAELKAERGNVRPVQQLVVDRIRKARGEAYVWRPSDWPEVVVALTGRARSA